MRFLTFSRLSRGRLLHSLAWGWMFSTFAIPALTHAQQVRGPAAHRRPAGLLEKSGGTYEYGYDPYDGKMESRAFAAQGYSAYAERFYVTPPIEAVPPRRTPQPSAEVYGYVEPESPTQDVSMDGRGAIFGYYYDPETGQLEYGWHEDRTSTVRRPIPREEATRRVPVDWRAVNRDELRRPVPYSGQPARVERDLEQFRGQVVEITTYTDRTSNRVHLIARIRQPDDMLRAVEMGPFATTTVSEGDWIEGFGPRAVVQGGPVIRARHVSVNGVWQAIQDTSSPEIRNFNGEILSLRSVSLTHRPGSQVIAEVRVGANTVETVILGPTSALREQTRLAVNDRIAFWARPGTLDGLPVLVATQIDLGDRLLDVSESGIRSSTEDLLIPVE